MARLIDADALKEKKISVCTYDKENGTQSCDIVFVRHIDEAPAVDAVEVVRCKDCKHHDKVLLGNADMCICTKYLGLTIPKPDDFCSYGERKNNA